MTMHKALHPRDDVDRLYVSRKEGGRGLANIEDSVEASIQQLGDYIEMSGGRLIAAIRNNTENTKINRTKITRNNKWGNIDVLSDKQATSHSRKLRRGSKRETFREILNLF